MEILGGSKHSGFPVHTHATNFGPLTAIGVKVFKYDPLSNALIAISIVTAITQFLIACSPPLSGLILQFLVAFAAGGILGTVFVHMLPEINITTTSSLFLLCGFLTFVVLDKILRIVNDITAGESSSHSHSHSHSHSRSEVSKSSFAKEDDKTVEPREQEYAMQTLGPLINVIADSLHNVTDGVSLVVAFRQSCVHGFSAFIIMCCHEIPHQFGDYALLINSGQSKPKARKFQLVTALGTVLGCLLGNWLMIVGPVIEEVVTPMTAGALLYVGTINVLPELLGTDPKLSASGNFGVFVVQALGVYLGISLLKCLE